MVPVGQFIQEKGKNPTFPPRVMDAVTIWILLAYLPSRPAFLLQCSALIQN